MRKTELTNLKITHVSYVKKGANKKQFFLMKSDDDTNFEKDIKLIINKSNDEQKLIYGIVYEPNEVDTQGEFAKAEEIEKAAHEFLSNSRNIDFQHNFGSDYGTVVESYIAPVDFKIENENIKKGAWVLVTKAKDNIWEAVKNGDITGYSMAGKANKIKLDNENLEKAYSTSNDDDVKGFFNVVKEFFSHRKEREDIQKSGKSISNFNMQKIDAAIEALSQLKGLNEMENKNEENDEMKKEEIQEIVQKAIDKVVKPINEKLNLFENNNSNVEKEDDIVSKQDIEQIVSSTITQIVEPINQRLENIEKSKGISKQQLEQQQNNEKSIFSGLQI